jgi:MoxR-like ATPase
MKESLPENYPNLAELSEERKKLRSLDDEKTPKAIQKAVESKLSENREKAAGVIENLGGLRGGLSRAKEKMREDRKKVEKSEVVDIESVEKEMGEEFSELERLHADIDEISDFIMARQRESQTDKYARKTTQSMIDLSVKEKTSLQNQIAKIEMEHPEVARAFEFVQYKKDLAEEGHIAHTPSVEMSQSKIARRMMVGKSMFLHGPTGTGKTSQARLASKQMTGHDPEMVYCNPQTREGNIWGKTGIRPAKDGSGAIETVSILGPLAEAMEEGKTIIFDEFTALPQEQMVMIKGVFNAKPGDTVNIVGNGKITIKPGFQMLFTANLKSDKNPERQPLPPEIAREFAQNNLEIKYTPQDESWDIMVTRLLNPDGSIDISQYDLNTTLQKLAEAMVSIQTAYTGEMTDEIARETQTMDAGGKKQSLKKLVLTQGDIESIMDDWNIEKQMQGSAVQKTSFVEFLDQCLKTGLTFKEYPEKDRINAAKILASKGFLTTLSAQDLDLPADIFTFTGAKSQRDKQSEKIQKSQKVEHISLKELSQIDPYNRRGQKMKEVAEGFFDEKDKAATSAEPTTPESKESINTDMTQFLLETYKGWGVDQTKLNSIKWKEYDFISPKNENYQTRKDDIDPAKYGEYTMNPETKNTDWDKIPPNKIKTVELPANMNGKKLSEIGQYLKTAYPNAKLPGLEYYKYILENPAKAPASLKDGNYHFFFGSLFRSSDDLWFVPFVDGGASGLRQSGDWLGSSWSAECRVVLLEN